MPRSRTRSPTKPVETKRTTTRRLPTVYEGLSLFISLAAFGLSFAHYALDADAVKQPYRTANYQARLDSFKWFNNQADAWMQLKVLESRLDGNLLALVDKSPADNLMSITVSREAERLGSATLVFYKNQVINRALWPDLRASFDNFDKTISKMEDCAVISAAVAKTVSANRASLLIPRTMIMQEEPRCAFKERAKDVDIEPYRKVVGLLASKLAEQGGEIAK